MRHLTISEFGNFLGISGAKLVVKDKEGKIWQTPLSRLRTIRVEKKGVSLSSDLIYECAIRGIRLFFTDWSGRSVATVQGDNQKAVVAVRQAQFKCIESPKAQEIALEIIKTKIKNQRAVLLYFGKYLKKTNEDAYLKLSDCADFMSTQANKLNVETFNSIIPSQTSWKQTLLGLEGSAAQNYWKTISACNLLADTFLSREGRGSKEISNAALNYGYAILMSYVFSALDNTGLEIYSGLFHSNVPGRASLVMDVMEEYRSWIVDRNIIKLRSQLAGKRFLDANLKSLIANSIDETLYSKVCVKGKNIKVENLMQRQAYRLAGSIVDDTRYKGFKFKW